MGRVGGLFRYFPARSRAERLGGALAGTADRSRLGTHDDAQTTPDTITSDAAAALAA